MNNEHIWVPYRTHLGSLDTNSSQRSQETKSLTDWVIWLLCQKLWHSPQHSVTPPHCYMPLPKERNWSSHVQHNLRSHLPSEASDPILSNFISDINPSTSEYLCNLFALPYTIWFFSLFFPSTSNVCFLLKDVAWTWVSRWVWQYLTE